MLQHITTENTERTPFSAFGGFAPSRKTQRRSNLARLYQAFTEGTYWSGVGGKVTFTPTATGIETTFNNTTWNRSDSSRISEVTNAQSGGYQKVIASVAESSGSFDVVWDSGAVPSTLGIGPGLGGVIKEYMGASAKYKSQTVMIEKVDYKVNTQNGAIMASISYKSNGAVTDN